MSEKLKIGIFGCGRGQAYIDNFKKLSDRVEIKAICDKREWLLNNAKNMCPAETLAFTSFDEFIECGLDAVVLCNFFHEHTPFAIRCMEKGIPVLSETTPASTMAEAVELVRTVERTGVKYMFGENYPFFCANQEIKRLYESGKLGRVLYAEGEYVHPMDADGLNGIAPTPDHWRAWMPKTYYLTHSLGPLMYITGENPVSVNAKTVFAPELYEGTGRPSADGVSIMLCHSESGAIFRIMGTGSFAPHGNWYHIGGSKGGAETVRGDEGSVRLGYNYWCVPEGEEERRTYKAEWSSNGELAEKAGHGGGDFWVAYNFVEYLLNDVQPFFDVYRAALMSAVGILAWRSSMEHGKEYKLPDFRKEEDRVLYENDDASPFPGAKNHCVPSCSHPDYVPSPRKEKK